MGGDVGGRKNPTKSHAISFDWIYKKIERFEIERMEWCRKCAFLFVAGEKFDEVYQFEGAFSIARANYIGLYALNNWMPNGIYVNVSNINMMLACKTNTISMQQQHIHHVRENEILLFSPSKMYDACSSSSSAPNRILPLVSEGFTCDHNLWHAQFFLHSICI